MGVKLSDLSKAQDWPESVNIAINQHFNMSSYDKSAPGISQYTFDQWEVVPFLTHGAEVNPGSFVSWIHFIYLILTCSQTCTVMISLLMFSTGSRKDAFCKGLRLTDGLAHICAGCLLCRR